jgi:putative hemolysin
VILTFLIGFRVVAQKNRMNHPVAIAKAVALPMKISIITAPFIWLLTHATEFCVENSADKSQIRTVM